MSRYSRFTGALLILLILFVQARASSPALASVQKIYIGSFGHSDAADRLVLLLKSELTKRGFTIVGDKAAADGVLSGILTVQQLANRTEARVTASLEAPNGDVLWTGDYGGSFHFGNDAVKWRASDIAKNLKKAKGTTRK